MFVRLLIIFLIAAIAAAVLYSLNPFGDKLSLSLPELPDTPSLDTDDEKARVTKVYKWQDKDGEWHFSNHPPAEGVARKVIIYRSDTNVIQSPKTSPKPAKPSQPSGEPETTASPLMPITDPDKVKKLMDDAKNIENLLQDRQEQMDKRIDGAN
jgi:hypothetical protein